jgi:hypothetical protein
MRHRVVKRQREPGYPTRPELLIEPRLLRTGVPTAWRGHPILEGAAALALSALIAGCGGGEDVTPSKGASPGSPTEVSSAAEVLVAPLFKHGEGRGATGCIVTSPPVFLSEEEAMQVIAEELSRAGIRLKSREVKLESVKLSPRFNRETIRRDGSRHDEVIPYPERGTTHLVLDGLDPDRKVAVVFLSEDDYHPYGGVGRGSTEHVDERTGRTTWTGSTVSSYDYLDLGRWVTEKVRKGGRPEYSYGIFYDPISSWELEKIQRDEQGDFRASIHREDRKVREKSAGLLRRQVADFVAWLAHRDRR